MGLLGHIITKGVTTAARNSTIRAVGNAATQVIVTKANNPTEKEDMVVKNGVVLIKPTRSSNDYCGENALEIARELLGVGFNSVTLKPVNTLSERAKKRYGEIRTISINGKDDFLGIKKVPASSYIVIEYSDFKQNVDASVYSNVERITPGVMNRIEPQAQSNIPERVVTQTSALKRFCPYCGSLLTVEGARFCSNCGNGL